MELIYNGVDISSSVTLQTANLIDSAGGRFDSIELEFEDSAGDWSRWKPALGDTVRLIQDGFDTGTCSMSMDSGSAAAYSVLRRCQHLWRRKSPEAAAGKGCVFRRLYRTVRIVTALQC